MKGTITKTLALNHLDFEIPVKKDFVPEKQQVTFLSHTALCFALSANIFQRNVQSK